jgi:hypothetical protein
MGFEVDLMLIILGSAVCPLLADAVRFYQQFFWFFPSRSDLPF